LSEVWVLTSISFLKSTYNTWNMSSNKKRTRDDYQGVNGAVVYPAKLKGKNSAPDSWSSHNSRKVTHVYKKNIVDTYARGNGKNNKKTANNNKDGDRHLLASPEQLLGDRFTVQFELGEGTFGKVYQCTDAKHEDIVAVKCIRDIDRYTHSAKIETRILRKTYAAQEAAQVALLVKLYTSFTHNGHYCMVFEPLGRSLLDYIQQNKYCGFPLSYVRLISAQLLSALTFLQGHGLIHTDLKLENVLFVPNVDMECNVEVVTRTGTETKKITLPRYPNIKLIDFGGATYDTERKSSIINTRQYRGPEVTLELGWSFPSDVWSAGCIIAELVTGDLLFGTHSNIEHLAMMQKLCGKFPSFMVYDSPVSRNFWHRGTTNYRTYNQALYIYF
jgi:serine/threonine protein kinase